MAFDPLYWFVLAGLFFAGSNVTLLSKAMSAPAVIR